MGSRLLILNFVLLLLLSCRRLGIYGAKFNDEKIKKSHDRAGVVSMANSGTKNSNSSQFFILFEPLPKLDKHHVIFGQVQEEYVPHLFRIRDLAASASGAPRVPVTVVDSGVV